LNVNKTTLHNWKKNDIIREVIEQYVNSIEKAKKSKMQLAIEKTKDIDKKEFSDFEDTINDSM
jgi:predicted DNA-binding protein